MAGKSLVLLFFLALAGCSSSDPATVIGHVWGMSGSLEGVTATAAGKTATSDADGRFLLDIPRGGTTVLKLEKDGQAPHYRPVTPGGASQLTLSVFLHEPTLTTTVDVTSAPATLDVDADLTLEFPQDCIRTASGSTPDGPVDVTVTWLGRINPSLSPVPLVGTDGDEVWPMISYGMVDLEIEFEGERCEIADGSSVSMRVPFVAGDEAEASMFSVDTDRGLWVEESQAENDGQYWTGEITHLSWWNLDLFWKVDPEDWACVVFRARSRTGSPIAGVSIRSAPSERYSFGGTTNDDGDLCNDRFPLGVTIELQWGTFLDTTSELGVLGGFTFTPAVPGVRCGDPECQVVEIPVECSQDRHCSEGRFCVEGQCNEKSDGDITGSCLYVEDTCNQFGSGFPEDNVRQACADGGGTFSTGPCPTDNEVGRCRYNQGTQGGVEAVYYGPTYTGLEADLRDGCENVLQGIWIPAG